MDLDPVEKAVSRPKAMPCKTGGRTVRFLRGLIGQPVRAATLGDGRISAAPDPARRPFYATWPSASCNCAFVMRERPGMPFSRARR